MAKKAKAKKAQAPEPEVGTPIGYRLRSISVVEFQIHNLSDFQGLNDRIQFAHHITYAVDENASAVTVRLGTVIVQNDEDLKTPLATLRADVEFEIQGIEHLRGTKKGTYKLPPGFQASLVGASIGTVRGIFWTKVQGTKISNVIVPLVDPRHLSEHMSSKTN